MAVFVPPGGATIEVIVVPPGSVTVVVPPGGGMIDSRSTAPSCVAPSCATACAASSCNGIISCAGDTLIAHFARGGGATVFVPPGSATIKVIVVPPGGVTVVVPPGGAMIDSCSTAPSCLGPSRAAACAASTRNGIISCVGDTFACFVRGGGAKFFVPPSGATIEVIVVPPGGVTVVVPPGGATAASCAAPSCAAASCSAVGLWDSWASSMMGSGDVHSSPFPTDLSLFFNSPTDIPCRLAKSLYLFLWSALDSLFGMVPLI